MRVVPVLLCALVLAGCGSSNDGSRDMDTGSAIVGGSSRITLGVNSYLWQASLNTLSFLPLASSDPFGGVINTEWYIAPSVPDERLKVTVYIMDRQLRADALKVVVFRQTRTATGWVDTLPGADTGHKLEDAILTRARELRLASLGQQG